MIFLFLESLAVDSGVTLGGTSEQLVDGLQEIDDIVGCDGAQLGGVQAAQLQLQLLQPILRVGFVGTKALENLWNVIVVLLPCHIEEILTELHDADASLMSIFPNT